MNLFTKFSLKNAASIFLISLLLIVGGIYSFSKLKMDLLPDLDVPAMVVQVINPGATASDMEEQVNKQVEKQMKGIASLDTFSTTSSDNSSFYIMQFDYGTDMDKKEKEVNDILEKANLPEKATTNVMRFTTGSIPVINATLQGKNGEDIQELVQNELKDELENVEGINEVQFFGLKKNVVEVSLNKAKALSMGVTMQQIQEAIEKNQVGVPVGVIKENDTNMPIRLEKTADSLNKLTITTQTGKVALKDIAKIKAGEKTTQYGRHDGKDVVAINVTKTQDANTVEVTDKVMDVLKKHKDELKYHTIFEQADNIKSSVKTLVKEGLFGALFASVTILIFLRSLRATLIAIVSIPLSLLITGIVLHQLDITLNVMTLGAMAIAVGRVVDDSIVVIENIYRRMKLKKENEDKNEIVIVSTKEIVGAITASTVTTAVVFLPIGLVGGVAGQFFLPFALTVVIALFASLLVAVTLVPILAKYSFKKDEEKHVKEGMLEKIYVKIIKAALRHKLIVMIVSIVLLVASFSIVPKLGFTFIPNEKQKMLIANVSLDSATPIDKTNTISLEIEKKLKDNKQIDDVTTLVGESATGLGSSAENEFSYYINLSESADTDKETTSIKKLLEKELPKEAEVDVGEMSQGGPSGSNQVSISLYSTNMDELQKDAQKVESLFKKDKTLKNTQNNFKNQKERYTIKLDENKMKKYGVQTEATMGMVASQLQNVTFEYTEKGKTQNVEIQYDKQITSKKELEQAIIISEKGPITLGTVAKVVKEKTFDTIQKSDGKIYAEVTAETTSSNIQQATKDIQDKVEKEVKLHKNTKIDVGGGSEEAVEAFGQIGMAMVVAVGLVYLTMLLTFKKARLPFVILSSLVFVPIGALGALLITGEPLSVSVMIGILMLIGIVTTNAIVFVDRVGQNIESKGMKIRESLIEAGKTRLRPILMTAFATVTALIPLALSTASGTLISKGLAIVVIGGLTTSTILTLIVIPVIYEIFYFKKVKKQLKETKEKHDS